MRVYLLGIILIAISTSAFGISRADTLLSQLTVEEKVAMLFVKIPDKEKADSVVLGNTRFDSFIARDIRKGFSDTLSLSFPDEETFRTISKISTVNNLLDDAFAVASLSGFNGIVAYDKLPNVSRLYMGHNAIRQQRYIRIIDFPCDLLDELLRPSFMDSKRKNPLGDIPTFAMWKQSVTNQVCFNDLLEQDLLFWENVDSNCYEDMVQAVYAGRIDEDKLNERICKLLNHKVGEGENIRPEFNRDHQLSHRYEAYKNSIAIYQKEVIFPVVRVDSLSIAIKDCSTEVGDEFVEIVNYYQPNASVNDSNSFVQMFLCDDAEQLVQVIAKIEAVTNEEKFNALVFIGALDNKMYRQAAQVFDALLIMPQSINESPRLVAEAIYSGISVSGVSPIDSELNQLGFRSVNASKNRLAFNSLTTCFSQDSIAKIDSIVFDAIKKKATPGAQLLVVKKGEVVLQKSYGYHTYKRKQKVNNNDLYDVASITKLAVTFPLVMQLYEEGQLDLDARLREYLPEIDTTDKADITIRELLLHQSGLISYIPFHYKALDRESLGNRSLYSRHYSWLYNIRVDTRLYQNKYARYRQDVFTQKSNGVYNRQLTSGMFMNEAFVDSMYAYIYASPLRSYKDYRYSDLGYYLLQRIIEKEENESLDSLYYSRISRLLGANNLVYKPLDNYSSKSIVPTENDLGFRKTLLDGYVHDQGAAMLGGVAAHAGLFANAGDLAKLGQMLINEGKYGGTQFVNPRTIGSFTKTVNHGNRRGMGVDKPEINPDENSHVSHRVSQASYGHTGFTGTILWIDPEHDIIYIFLSNRIHPRSYNKKLIELNVRTKIQDVIYNSLSQ